MSVNGSGQFGSYTPPPPSLQPPTRASKSPWLYVSLGCGFMFLLIFGGCIAAGMMFSGKLKQELAHPVTEAAVNKGLDGIPRYPDATFDNQTTTIMQATMFVFRRTFVATDDGVVAVYRTSDPFLKVMSWYDDKLRAQGFTATKTQGNFYCYKKGTKIVGIQATSNARADEGKTPFTLLYFRDAKGMP